MLCRCVFVKHAPGSEHFHQESHHLRFTSWLLHCRELLVIVMRKHQRYFPVYDSDDQLQPVFVTVANGPVDKDLVRVSSWLM